MIYVLISEQKIERKAALNKLVKELLGEVNDFNFEKFDGEDPSVAPDFIMSAMSLPFGSDKKVVLIESPFFYKISDNKFESKNIKEDLINLFNEEIEGIDIIISINSEDYNKDANEVTKIIEKKAKIEDETIKGDVVDKIIKRVEKRGAKIERNAAVELANRIKNDLNALIQETNKLMLYTNHIKLLDVEKLVSKPLEDNIYLISNSLAKGNNMSAFDIYQDLKANNVEPVTIIGMLGKEFRLLYDIKYLVNSGKSKEDVMKAFNLKEVRAKILISNSTRFSKEKLEKILKDLHELDYKIKSGQVDRFYALEIFLITFETK